MPTISPIKSFERSFIANNGYKFDLKVTSKSPLHYDLNCMSVNKKGRVQAAYNNYIKGNELSDYVKSIFLAIDKIKGICSDNKLVEDLTDFMINTIK